jgi:hypothetical protein
MLGNGRLKDLGAAGFAQSQGAGLGIISIFGGDLFGSGYARQNHHIPVVTVAIDPIRAAYSGILGGGRWCRWPGIQGRGGVLAPAALTVLGLERPGVGGVIVVSAVGAAASGLERSH